MTETPPTPPGWYPDGQGAIRWWDGQAWTDQTQPVAPPAPPPPMPAPATVAPPADAAKKQPSKAVGCLVLIVLVIAVGALIGALSGGDSGSKKDTGPRTATSGEAWQACKEFVGDRLKAPSSADFPSDPNRAVKDLTSTPDKQTWVINGVVDSQNSFGAQIRTAFVCKVAYTPADDMWRSTDITML